MWSCGKGCLCSWTPSTGGREGGRENDQTRPSVTAPNTPVCTYPEPRYKHGLINVEHIAEFKLLEDFHAKVVERPECGEGRGRQEKREGGGKRSGGKEGWERGDGGGGQIKVG